MENKNFSEIYRRLFVYIKPQWKFFVLAVVGMVFYSIGNAGFAALMKPLLDEGLFAQTAEGGAVWKLSWFIIGVFLIRGLGSFLSTYYLSYVGNVVIKELRSDMFEHLLCLPATYFDQQPKGRILAKLIHNVGQTTTLITKLATVVLRDSMTIIALLGWLFYLNWMMALMFLLLGIPIIAVAKISGKRFRKVSFKLQDVIAMISGDVQQIVDSHVEIKMATAQEYEQRNFEINNQQFLRQGMRMTMAQALSVPIIMFLAGLGVVFIVHVSQIDFIAQNISIGTFVSFIFGITLLFRPLRGLATLHSSIEQGRAGAVSVFELLDEPPEKAVGEILQQPLKGAISFRNVSFRYFPEQSLVLDDLNLDIEPGETIALVGRSGSGKTTLANLIMQLYEPAAGLIEIDGYDISGLNIHELRRQISYVAQHTTLSRSSIRENIAYGVQADEAAVVRAAREAQLIPFINQLPEKFETRVENQIFSGGQSQRISIARALLRDTPILIFDEVTSAQDYETEKQIRNAFSELKKNRTVLIITHRFSMIGFADRIILLEKGKIAEQGTHKELIEQEGTYHKLYHEQILE